MVLSRKDRVPAEATHSQQDSFHFFGQPVYMPPSKGIGDGISAIVESMESGALSEEMGSELIRILLAAYLEATVSSQIAGYLDPGISDILLHQLEEGELVVEESDRKPDEESTEASLAELQGHEGDSEENGDHHPIPSELLERVPPEHRRAVISAVSSFTQLAGPVLNPIFQRITSDHVSSIIDNRENESIREHEADKSRRKYQFWYFLIAICVVVGLILLFITTDNRDMITPLLAAIAGFLGGLGFQRFRP